MDGSFLFQAQWVDYTIKDLSIALYLHFLQNFNRNLTIAVVLHHLDRARLVTGARTNDVMS